MNGAADFLLVVSIKSLGWMAAVALLMVLWRRGAAAARHFLWFSCLGGLLLLPCGPFLGATWHAPAWAGGGAVGRWTSGAPVKNSSSWGRATSNILVLRSSPTVASSAVPAPGRRVASVHPPANWRRWVLILWIAGAAATLSRLFWRWAALGGIERASRELDDAAAQSVARSVRGELGIKRGVRLLVSASPLMPMTWGWWRPVVLLPPDCPRWEGERLRFVLRHELAHVKRRDCLTQGFANLVGALYWFNPLVWLALGQMRLERERACDDAVLALDTRASDYAGHLLAVARQFCSSPPVAALPIARLSSLEARVRALLDARRKRERLGPLTAGGLAMIAGAAALAVGSFDAMPAPGEMNPVVVAIMVAGGFDAMPAPGETNQPVGSTFTQKLVRITPELLRSNQLKRLQSLYLAKQKQALDLADSEGKEIEPSQPGGGISLFWYLQSECDGARELITVGSDPNLVQTFGQDLLNSIPKGSIFFGQQCGGGSLAVMVCKSQIAGDPFFTMSPLYFPNTEYRAYLRAMYGAKLNLPTEEDVWADMRSVSEASGNASADAEELAVPVIKDIFDRNPDRRCFIEETDPAGNRMVHSMNWILPCLEPHGPVLEICRQPLAALTEEVIAQDRAYWKNRVARRIGKWLTDDTPMQKVVQFGDLEIHGKDLTSFTEASHLEGFCNSWSVQMASNFRGSIAALYAWRAGALKDVRTPAAYLAPPGAARQRLVEEADLAFRQAFAFSPFSFELMPRYVYFLSCQDRSYEALTLAETVARDGMGSEEITNLITQLKERILIDPIKKPAELTSPQPR
jgi:beta-lactamase regulating signal transducer with metallopeptidase domain